MCSPYTKVIGIARAPLAAVMVGKTIGKALSSGQLPSNLKSFGSTKDEIFITSSELRKQIGHREFETLPTGAIGLYTYYGRLAQGLRQLMAGCRKFSLQHISRDDLAALTHEASEVSNLPYIMDVDRNIIDDLFLG
jgi:hypothetical protein